MKRPENMPEWTDTSAEKHMVEDLKEQGLLVKVVPHSHNVGTHDRCHTTVEPMIKQQWFVKMDEMIKPAVEGVKNGEIKLLPSNGQDILQLAGEYP